RRHFPELKIVFEHITTKEAAQYVQAGNRFLGATITPQHLMFMFQTRHRIPETALREDQILIYQVPIPEPLRFIEPRETETRKMH
ncbi:alpha-D-ribose 1-methylphosphonate 5-phosphate C-P-lyase PhnJ, partial [Serratia sp. ME43]|uniref:alpha-D-ribose 1-methylphosphonate 5-phosphate C-P-lyase PhnJ n=1 Tax=Serratia sp. ME43 TaxID=2744256 RepID=UPI0021062634